MTETGGAQAENPYDGMTARQLLAGYVGTLNEMLSRGLVRTRNAPLGDVAEHIAWKAYGGELASNSKASFDLRAADERLLQVKARAFVPGDRRSQPFSPFRSFGFDAAVFLLFDASTYDLTWAREVPVDEVRALGRRSNHTNSDRVTTRQAASAGVDVTEKLAKAYEGLG